jgi:integrase
VIADVIKSFEQDYFSKRERTPQSETTWKVEYATAFAKLDTSRTLDGETLLAAILSSRPNSRTRKRLCQVYKNLAKFAGLDFDPTAYAGRYRFNQHNIRTLPTDDEIVAMRELIASPEWRYAFSLMAAFGLRNHEVFNLDLDSLKNGVAIVESGKTGRRKVWPFRPEWLEVWDLANTKLPVCTGKNNRELGARVTKYFSRNGLCKPYDLRHAWAVRTLEMGLDISLAAAQMGHSLAVHSQVYHDFISDRTHQRAFEKINRRASLPLPD